MNKALREQQLRTRGVAHMLRGMRFDHLPSKEKRNVFAFLTKKA